MHLGGVELEDIRWQPYFSDEMTAAAKAAGNGHAPWLEVDGKFLFQTSAIARYCADVAGLTPTDAWLAAKVDEVVQSVTYLQSAFMLALFEGGSGEKTTGFLEVQLPKWLGFFERLLRDNGTTGFFVGGELTVADIAVWRFVDMLDDAVLGKPMVQLFDGTMQSTYPLLALLYDRLWAHPKIKGYMDSQYPPGCGVNIMKESSPMYHLYPPGSGKWISLGALLRLDPTASVGDNPALTLTTTKSQS